MISLTALAAPITSVSFVSVSIYPEDNKRKNESSNKLSNIDKIYNNNLFSHQFIGTYNNNDNHNHNQSYESRQGSQASIETLSSFSSFCSNLSLNSNSHYNYKIKNNCKIQNLPSPSLKSVYADKKATSFKNLQKLKCSASYEESLFNNSLPSFSSLSLSYKSPRNQICSLQSDYEHPLLILDNEDEYDHNNNITIDQNSNLEYFSNLEFININNANNTHRIRKNKSFSNSQEKKIKLNSNNSDTVANSKKLNLISFLKKLHDSVNRSLDSSLKVKVINKFNYRRINEFPLETFSQKFESIPTFHENIEINSSDFEKLLPIQFFGKTRRIRENRINPSYLLQYSIDNYCRSKGYFNMISDNEIDIFDDLLLEKYSQISGAFDSPLNEQIFDDVFECKLQSRLIMTDNFTIINEEYLFKLKLASIARYKLWANATLLPRQDQLPNFSRISKDIYFLPSLDTCQVPWLNIKDLKAGRAINRLTRSAGLLKNSNIQYVSKKCSSKRWVCNNI
jgi:hypothetical protein